MRKGKGGTRDAFESPRVRPRAVTKACESGTPSILSDPVSCTFISSMTHGFVSVCQDQGVLVRREERGAAEVPSFRLLRRSAVIFSTPQPYQLVRLMINQDFGWQPAGRLTKVSTSLGTSWRPAHLSFGISNPRFITRFITRFSPRSRRRFDRDYRF